MDTIFGGQEYFGMSKQNKVAKDQYLKANPDVGSIFYMYSYLPHKPVVFGLTDKGYFEGTFTFGVVAGLKNYTKFQAYPYESIKEFLIDGGSLYIKADLSVAGAFVINKIGVSETMTTPTSVTPGEIQIIIEGIHGAQETMGLAPAKVTTGQVESENEEESTSGEQVKSVGETADELMKAKSLLDMGAISEQEFADLKKKILGA